MVSILAHDRPQYATHDVTNQPPPLTPYDASDDAALLEGLRREGAQWAEDDVRRLGRTAGSAEAQEWAEQANRYEPELRTHDRYGNRIDEVDFHPSWHHLMRVAVGEGLAGAPWADGRPGAHVARIAGALVWGHTDAGHSCPTAMTYAVVPALRRQPELAAVYEPLLTGREYDPGLRVPTEKRGLLAGMGMTEKQGGSDVRTNTTTATPGAEPGMYTLRGHKWFTSAPMCDLFLVLAQAPDGLTCFLVPRVLPDGSRNTFRIQRLKDKLGNRSNASSEPEFDGTVAWRVGPEGQGVKTIIEMVNCTRLDCVMGTAALMRKTLVEAGHHAGHRSAFGARLLDQPLMRNVLADLALESEAATTLTLRLAGAADRGLRGDAGERMFRRIATAVAKYWVTKRGPAFTAEALECFGGNGYVEESGMPRHYREAPLASIWEGSGNVNALDVLRALTREPGTADALFAELAVPQGADTRLDAAVARLKDELRGADQTGARRLVEHMALTLQASLLVRHAPAAVADAFCATRLGGDWGHSFGTLPNTADLNGILGRALPA
ncbi:DNA alkylation response protein [Streptomyces ipomoeae]|uniref:Acyl-CoA dehydrogenase, C-terminal domain protein n=2 Tax=Streptomyces ipomoeae TaxID=103232 RepID=L1KTG1_9ACTN|nr:DNA alkylation response protein [Streptomyces ipomoeae]EKX63678.1 acyl-CoA dehydrogenase, C-terminal domain protein [Streptomyces ipomoeae 91-03]MDX2692594.1 DNA alkylation response protein [Streptomyces ipomoeae]MDX2819544.1 DNA alkylation response protein [Streptomyces ipomoeae]MDX2840814.1 DNA alkylation response protein [Streptomyces ipomoeae]MDX2873327.1 DNA alkylation response protein [Streptomyces ipomoeae]